MTEQEVDEWIGRLTRVWAPLQLKVAGSYLSENPNEPNYGVRLTGEEGIEVRLLPNQWNIADPVAPACSLRSHKRAVIVVGPGKTVRVFEWTEVEERIAQQYLPFFRRGCWLSGFDIEATAHEKMEWLQGFTREEIEAWNLKF